MMPVLGSRPATGLELAQELFRNAGLVEGRILVLTDGIKGASEISDFRNAAFPYHYRYWHRKRRRHTDQSA